MKKLNLLNRTVLFSYRLVFFILQACGVCIFTYNERAQLFRLSPPFCSYALLLLLFNKMYLLMLLALLYRWPLMTKEMNYRLWFRWTSSALVCLWMRYHHMMHAEELLRLLNDCRVILSEVRVIARHPNIFRISHFVLCLVAVQSLLRSISMVVMGAVQAKGMFIAEVICKILFDSMYQMSVAMVMLIFIALIACYDELHLCTRRISTDVWRLRMAQVLQNGQRMVLMAQLCGKLEDLVAVRARVLTITVRLLHFFKFNIFMAILYWLEYDTTLVGMSPLLNQHIAFYNAFIAMWNVAFYCSIFEIFMRRTKLSNSFWNFHLVNYSRDFDRAMDELVHRELIERMEMRVYGLRLDMRFFCKILLLVYAYILISFGFRRINQL